MFVLQSTHNRTLLRLHGMNCKYQSLLKEWNDLVTRINELGGQRLLTGGASRSQFTADEIETLVKLCHPDKHGGCKKAEEITKRLLAMRKANTIGSPDASQKGTK